jgi:hypothetical protein
MPGQLQIGVLEIGWSVTNSRCSLKPISGRICTGDCLIQYLMLLVCASDNHSDITPTMAGMA